MNILDVRVSVTNLDRACAEVDSWIKAKHKAYVCVAPVATIMEAQDDENFRDIVNQADMVTPDGMPLVWSGKLKGKSDIDRTYGPDLMLALCERGQAENYRHFLYGADEPTNRQLVENLKKRFPQINIVGHWAPPFRDKDQMESVDILKMINNASADILWVGLGAPKQEYWMYNHRSKLDVPVMIGIGAAFDFLAGIKKQAPVWMRKTGLEWLFRFGCEPKRLWRRYLIGNTRFVFLSLMALGKPKTKRAQA